MYTEGDKVRIKATGLVCEVVDVRQSVDGRKIYTVESDSEDAAGGYGSKWPLFDCSEEELEPV